MQLKIIIKKYIHFKMDKNLTLDQALKMEKPTEDFLLTLEDNTPGVRFNGFKLRDIETGEVIHEYYPEDLYELDYFADHILDYRFPNKLIQNERHLGTSLNLCVGNQLVKDLVLLERHYIDGKLAASFNFKFPIFMPNSQNNIEFIYNIPKMTPEVLEKIQKGEDVNAKSDTFIFVEGKLVVHRRAKYVYTPEESN